MNTNTRLRTSVAATALTLAAAVVLPSPAMAAPSAEPYEGLPSGTLTQKTLVIGVDGASFAKFGAAGVPNLEALMGAGITATSNLFANPMAPTVSGPAWSSIATGVWPDKHTVKDNNFTAPNFGKYPDYLSRLEQATPEASTAVVGTWSPVPNTIFGPGVDLRLPGGNDAGTTAKAADYLAHGNPDSMFVHLDEVDGAGHSGGTETEAYLKALNRADGQVGQLIEAVRQRPSYSDEEWLIVVTSDHGHTLTGGHGGNSAGERQVFVIAQGGGIKPGSVRHDVKIADIAPTALRHAGIKASAEWDLDGRSIKDLAGDDFDTLRGQLQVRVDETKPAADLKGWTTTAPEGWSIDNSAMPTGGVTEWSGWSFTTDEFWTSTDRGQGRETSVRNRNVFAVADSDEWDDKPHAAGQFDSTLISPDFRVKGGTTAALTFASNYRVDGPQTGDVYVSYDGGAPQLVKSYRSNSNGFERIELDVPAGAKQAKVHFHYTGTNSAFWTVDQLDIQRKA